MKSQIFREQILSEMVEISRIEREYIKFKSCGQRIGKMSWLEWKLPGACGIDFGINEQLLNKIECLIQILQI